MYVHIHLCMCMYVRVRACVRSCVQIFDDEPFLDRTDYILPSVFVTVIYTHKHTHTHTCRYSTMSPVSTQRTSL